jgi:ABC-type multidrug transport system ATPase subunit
VSESLALAEDLRVDVDGVPAVDGLTFRTNGESVLVLGAPRALFEALTGLRPASRGHLAVRGMPAYEAARQRRIAGCALDPPMPPRWTPLEYVTWNARLSGASSADAKVLARQALERVQLGAFAAAPLRGLVVHARRATVLAAALATGAEILAVEDPLGALPEETSRSYARIVAQALSGRPSLVFAPRMPLTSPLALAADDALVVTSSRLEAQGQPAEIASAERRFVLRVHGTTDALAARVAGRGGRLEPHGAQVIVDLGEALTTPELLGMCHEANVTVVELRPLSRALA